MEEWIREEQALRQEDQCKDLVSRDPNEGSQGPEVLVIGQTITWESEMMGNTEKSTGAIWDMVTKLNSLELEYQSRENL